MSRLGTLWLMPNTLDFGTAEPLPDIRAQLPSAVIERAAGLAHWVAENAKTTRAFLKRVDAVVRLAQPLQELQIVELPRPRKGGGASTPPVPLDGLLKPAFDGHDLGLISEAGLPAVADPGAGLVEAAHRLGIEVVALPGTSALVLALAASGLNGQSFAFVGYLPVDGVARVTRIRELEALSRRQHQTQLMIETPYRNTALFAALLAGLQPDTRLSVSSGLTLPGGYTRTRSVRDWRALPAFDLPNDVPTVFSLLAG